MSDQELADLQAAVTDQASWRDPVVERRSGYLRSMHRWATFARSLCILVTLIGLASISLGAIVWQPLWVIRGAVYAGVFAGLYFWSRRSLEVPVMIAAVIYAIALLTPAAFHVRLLSGSIPVLATQWVLVGVSLYALWRHRQTRRLIAAAPQR